MGALLGESYSGPFSAASDVGLGWWAPDLSGHWQWGVACQPPQPGQKQRGQCAFSTPSHRQCLSGPFCSLLPPTTSAWEAPLECSYFTKTRVLEGHICKAQGSIAFLGGPG